MMSQTKPDVASSQSPKAKPTSARLGTVAAIGFAEFPAAEWLGQFRRLGCQVVQVYRNPKANVSLQEMRDAIAAGQMPCDSLHGVYGEQFDPSAPDESERRSAVDTFKSEGELAAELNGPLVVVHCSSIRQDGVSDKERNVRIAQLRKSILDLGQFGKGIGVAYAFENLPGYHAIGSDVAELADMLRAVGAPNTGMCLDTGHAHMVGDAAEAICQAKEQMIYVHFSDNCGRSDDHDMPTCGTLDAEKVGKALYEAKYTGTIMLEVFYKTDRLAQLADQGLASRLERILHLANGHTQN